MPETYKEEISEDSRVLGAQCGCEKKKKVEMSQAHDGTGLSLQVNKNIGNETCRMLTVAM
jgi:hypothetical protein